MCPDVSEHGCMCECVCVQMCLCVLLSVCVCVCVFARAHACMHTCVHVSMFGCLNNTVLYCLCLDNNVYTWSVFFHHLCSGCSCFFCHRGSKHEVEIELPMMQIVQVLAHFRAECVWNLNFSPRSVSSSPCSGTARQ